MTFPLCCTGEGVLGFSELVPNPFAERSCNKMCWNQIIFPKIRFYIPLEKGLTLEQTWIPFCAKFDLNWPVILEKTILKSWQCFFVISLLSPLGNGRGPLFKQNWIPLTKRCFVPKLVKIDPVVLEKRTKMWKVYRWMTGEKTRFQELTAQMSLK